MSRTDVYIKVQLEHPGHEKPEKLAQEICRRLLELYAVRSAEVSNLITDP